MNQCDAIVVAATGNQVWVEIPARAKACANCPSPGACQTGFLGLGGLMGSPRRYRLDNELGLRVGDRVSLVVAEGTLLRASLASYLIPVLLAMGGAVAGQSWAGDAAAVAGTLAGLALGFVLLRRNEHAARYGRNPLSLQHRLEKTHLSKEVIKEKS